MLNKFRILFIVLLFLLVVVYRVYIQWPDEKFHYIQCDVGQGDGVVVTYGFFQAVYDVGSDYRIVDCLKQNLPFWDRNIEILMISHFDNDHSGGLRDVLEVYKVNNFFWSGVNPGSFDPESLKKSVDSVWDITQSNGFESGKLSMEVIWPDSRCVNELKNKQKVVSEHCLQKLYSSANKNSDNELSLTILLKYLDTSFLLVGDISFEVERELSLRACEVNVLKVGHHGSGSSSSEEFLSGCSVSPERKYGVIGVGKNNYGHPTEEVLTRLREGGFNIYRTDIDGIVELVSDGREVLPIE